MRPNEKCQKAKEINHALWNTMWQAFCPFLIQTPMQPQPIKLRAKRVRHFAAALAIVFSIATPAQANDIDGNIVLASLNNTTTSDRVHQTRLFGAGERRYTDIRPFTKWTGILSRFKREFAGSLNDKRTQDWMEFLSSLKDASKEEKIDAVNNYMNKVKFVPDEKNYASDDYWATPTEFMNRGGDCEDYAMAKYISLRALGFGQNEMRLAIVYDSVMRMPHALLIVYNDGKSNVLDNQNPGVMNSAEVTRYKPIYSISQVAWWRH